MDVYIPCGQWVLVPTFQKLKLLRFIFINRINLLVRGAVMVNGPSAMLRFCRQQPFITGVACAGMKGAFADVTSQLVMQDNEYRPLRTVAFTLWNMAYCGVVVFGLYSVLVPRVWPVRTLGGAWHPRAARHTAYAVAFDNLIATPFLCLPTYYLVHGVLEASWEERRRPLALAARALRVYASEARETLLLSWCFWVPIHTATFAVVPTKLRTHFVAACSFVTLSFMSSLQDALEDRRRRPDAQRALAASRLRGC